MRLTCKLTLLAFLFLSPIAGVAQQSPPTVMTAELLWKLGRLGEADLSAGGRYIAYGVRRFELAENRGRTSVHLFDSKTGEDRLLLSDWPSVSDLQFAPSANGERLYLVGKPDSQSKKAPQVYAVNPADGAVLEVSDVKDGVGALKVSPDGKHLAYTVEVKLDKEVSELYPDLPKANARIIDGLMYRHWNEWHDFKYSHIILAAVGRNGKAAQPLDLMEGRKVDSPVPPFGGSAQFDWSPNGDWFAYTVKDVPDQAQSTNSDVFLLKTATPREQLNVSRDNLGYDNDPMFSPDGKSLAYNSMQRAGFESDRNRLIVYELASGRQSEATAGLDQTVHDACWTPDSKGFVFASETKGTTQLFRIDRDAKGLRQVSQGRFDWSLRGLFPDGRRALAGYSQMERPEELAVVDLSERSSKPVSHLNDAIYRTLKLPKIEEHWIDTSDGKKMQAWVIKPPDFDPARKYPLLTYCQGGPQGQIGEGFSYRWNFYLMASHGYVVIAPNRRGLPGFGREWNDVISGDWGGQPMRDLLSATDHMLAQPYIDPTRAAAVGASYGGYSVYYLLGNSGDRFAAAVAHAGVFNLESMYGTTEELFFTNWELGGPYWKSPQIQKKYDQFSPHRYVKNWHTPLLVIHGEKDFRVPIGQGEEAFTAAQVQGVPSRFLYFPDEYHWVTQPQNNVLWSRVFFDWLDRYCKPEAARS
jgi:dipeptidyl aminopeptidase/acylaminoacyl peptidase